MSVYRPTMHHLREVLLYYFNSYKSASEAHRMLVHAYGKGIISLNTCVENFGRFRSGDFNLDRSTRKRLNKERVIGELVRLTLENPCITQAEIAAKVGISQTTISLYQRSQEYQNELKKLQQDQSSIPLERPTAKRPNKERVIKELVRLKLEDPNMTRAEMAAKVGVSVTTVWNYKKSQEYRNELKKLQQEQSSIPLERPAAKRPNKERVIKELVRLRLEDPDMTQAEMATKVGVTIRTVYNYQRSQEYQNELKKLQQDQSSIPSERTTLKRQHRELEEEESMNILDEIPPITPDERANDHGISISEDEGHINSVEKQNNLKENVPEKSFEPLERPSTSKTQRIELKDEELVHNMDEFPHLTPDELAEESDISISIAQTFINCMKKYNQ